MLVIIKQYTVNIMNYTSISLDHSIEQKKVYNTYDRLPDSPGLVVTAITSTPRSFKLSVPLLLTPDACSITLSNALGNASA